MLRNSSELENPKWWEETQKWTADCNDCVVGSSHGWPQERPHDHSVVCPAYLATLLFGTILAHFHRRFLRTLSHRLVPHRNFQSVVHFGDKLWDASDDLNLEPLNLWTGTEPWWLVTLSLGDRKLRDWWIPVPWTSPNTYSNLRLMQGDALSCP